MYTLPRSVPTSVVVRSVAATGTHFADLLPFAFGIFDEDTHTVIDGAFPKRRTVYMGVGSPNQRQFTQGSKFERLSNALNADLNFRSQPITTSTVDRIKFVTFKKSEKPNIYYLGYNGIDTCEGLKFDCGKTYSFNVVATGRPVRNIFGNDMRELITIETDCCDPCLSGDCDLEVPCQNYIDKLVAEFNDPNRWLSRFYTAERVMDCADPIEGLTRTNFTGFTLTICDNGDELALSAVQNEYPTLKVTVKSRNAPYTTYKVIVPENDSVADFAQGMVTLQNCNVCPSGYTAVPSGYTYLLKVSVAVYDSAFNTDAETTLSAITGEGITSAVEVNGSDAASYLFQVTSDAALTSSVADGFVVILNTGIQPARCLGPDTTTAWVEEDAYYKVQRDLCITIKVDDCDTDFNGTDPGETLERLRTLYASNTSVVANSLEISADSTDCLLRYTISQYNNDYIQDGCDTNGEGGAVFIDLPSFEGQVWTVCPCAGWTVDEETGCPVAPVAAENCCQCGIKFTQRPTTYILDEFPGYDIAQYLEKEPIELSVTPYYTDADTSSCDYSGVKWLQVQHATFRQLKGSDVVKRIITERFYRKEPWVNQTNKEDQLLLRREGIKLGINVDEFYYQFCITHNEQHTGNVTSKWNNARESFFIYVNENDTLVVDTLKNTLANTFQDAKLDGF